MLRLNFTMPMLERMTEGVILLDRQAALLGHNRAAEPWLASAKLLAPALKRLIDEEVQGRSQLPVRIDLAAHQSASNLPLADIWISKNGRRDYAIFIAPQRHAVVTVQTHASPQVAEKRYVSLFGDEVRQQIAVLQGQLTALLLGDLQDDHQTHKAHALLAQATRVGQLLKEISDLTLLMQRDLVFSDERIDPAGLMQGLLPEFARAQATNDIAVGFTPDKGQQGVVYGSAPWMGYALRVLIESLLQGAPKHSRIALATRQMGNFVVLTGHVVNAEVTLNSAARAALASPRAAVADGGAEKLDSTMRMLMCRRIVDLHGGQLKLELLPTLDVESFTLTLATGVPAHERSRVSCADCRYTLQAQSYAQDMAQMLSH